MALKFFGRGSGFTDNHTSAYFETEDNELVIIDCPVIAYQKLMRMTLKDYEEIYILITHTHGDHIGGLGLFVQYAFYTLGILTTIVVPSSQIAKDISTVLAIEDVESSLYHLEKCDTISKVWLCKCIPTEHTLGLKNKCFGYQLNINGTNVVYTGDTNTIYPFLPYLKKGSLLYVDTSVHYGKVHLKLDEVLSVLISATQFGVKVFLMHLDDIDAAKKMVANYPNINIVNVE